MARKKKPTRKYVPRNEFRKNHSPITLGHPNYVFGETKTKYKSLGLTSNPKADEHYVKLHTNPNPESQDASNLKLKVFTTKKSYFSEPLDGWAFDKQDMYVVRHTIKKYKKSTNRKSPKKKKR